MRLRQTGNAIVLSLALAAPAVPVSSQSVDEVRADVFSALSMPLPITIVGPLMTRDVVVVAEGDGFRASLPDASLMGMLPLGEVSLKLTPAGDKAYRVSELRFPADLDFPGLGRLTLGTTEIDGLWNAANRSYSNLRWALGDVTFSPGGNGVLQLGRLSFDVVKEPDDTDTESRLKIAAERVAMRGLTPEDVDIGGLSVALVANGEKPVDLYSLLREVIMTSGGRDGGLGLRNLGASLLGNSYGVVSLGVTAEGLAIADSQRPATRFLKAGAMTASATLNDVAPRDWGAADISVRLSGIDQRNMIDAGTVAIETAGLTLRGEDLPVADMFETVRLLAEIDRRRPLQVSAILDGVAEFGRLEISTDGKGLSTRLMKTDYVQDASGNYKDVTKSLFDIGFDTWALRFGMADFNRNEGKLYLGSDLAGGRLVPGEAFPRQALVHVKTWFPVALKAQQSVTNLNEGLLKTLFRDVWLQNPEEPVELLLPLMLYASSAVFDFTAEEGAYQTEVFRLGHKAAYKLYPTEILTMMPYEGEAEVTLDGLDGLLGYFDAMLKEARPGSDDAAAFAALKSALIVLRNLAAQAEGGGQMWQIARPDIRRPEIVVNGTTFRYPDLMSLVPMALGAAMRF